LGALKNYVREGYEFEKKMSLDLHAAHTPVLLSSLTLRELSLGQVDICVLKKNEKSKYLVIFECKSLHGPKLRQRIRLKDTADYLSLVLGLSAKIEVIFAKKHKLNYP
jgi:hypothetical protein